MQCNARKFVRVTKFLLAGVTVFCVSWIACVNEWHAGVRWRSGRGSEGEGRGRSTMRTIVGYSEGKLAELERPSPVTCDRLPAFPHVPEINRTWSPGDTFKSSWQHVENTHVSLYSAYYDERSSQRYVRILASFQGRIFSTEETLFCQTRPLNAYEDSVEVVAAKPLEIWWHDWDINFSGVETPLLLSCPLTEPLRGPSIVSVVTQPCDDPTNAFLLEPSQERLNYERNFTICVKDMNFSKDVSQNLIEWIETNKILGVEMIDIYIDSISQESEKVLLHYQDEGYVRLFHVPIKYKPERSLWQRRKDHIITYNDCLYRNIKESEYIVPLDVDEIVLPKVAYTWSEMLQRLIEHGWDSSQNSAILVHNVFFFDFMQGIDKYKHKKVYANKSKIYVKRDNVRIQEAENIDIGEIELIDDTNSLSNEVIDITDVERTLYKKYKMRCGKELPIPKLVHNIVSSAIVSPVGSYSKSLMVTKKVLTAFNHYPLESLGAGGIASWPAPFSEVQLNHYKESCNSTIVPECAGYGRRARVDRAALRLRRELTRALASGICTGINNT